MTKLYSLDGSFLGHCTQSMARWYLRKGQAKITNGQIRLLFDWENVYLCVSCGGNEKLSMYRLIPPQFLKCIPQVYKISNDTCLLCSKCMKDAHCYTEVFKKTLNVKYQISSDSFIDKDKFQLAHLAQHFVHSDSEGVPKRHAERDLQRLTQLLGVEPTRDQITEYAKLDYSIMIDDCQSVGEYIIKQVINKGQLEDFIKQWQDYFIKAMEIKFLPPIKVINNDT